MSSRNCNMLGYHVGYYYTYQIQKSIYYLLNFQNIFSNYSTERPERINNSPYIDCDPTLFRLR